MSQSLDTITRSKEILLKNSLGNLVALLIGIDKYNITSGFSHLKTCCNDAIHLKSILERIPQLNADMSRVKLITSNSGSTSRGRIIAAIRQIVESTETNDRLLIFYSGHGHRLKDSDGNEDFYLVPEDVYDSDDPNGLLSFHEIQKYVNNSIAKQKIIILDACMSGTQFTTKKIVAAKYSGKFLAEYFKSTKGIAILSSSSSDEASFTKSPDPALSLFTFYLLKGLEGDQNALDDTKMLTVNSLYDYISVEVRRRAKSYQATQTPNFHYDIDGTMVLADFSRSPINLRDTSFDEYPISNLIFLDKREHLDVKEVLTEIKRWSAYDEKYLERIVNNNIGEYLEDEFGKMVAQILNGFEFAYDSVSYSDNTLVFPGGDLVIEYESNDKRSGKLCKTVSFEKSWFSNPDGILDMLEIFNISPQGVTFELENKINPISQVSPFKAKGWKLDSVNNDKLIMAKDGYFIEIRDKLLMLSGVTPMDIFGENGNQSKRTLTFQALSLLTS